MIRHRYVLKKGDILTGVYSSIETAKERAEEMLKESKLGDPDISLHTIEWESEWEKLS